jgi:hypothetical protein
MDTDRDFLESTLLENEDENYQRVVPDENELVSCEFTKQERDLIDTMIRQSVGNRERRIPKCFVPDEDEETILLAIREKLKTADEGAFD